MLSTFSNEAFLIFVVGDADWAAKLWTFIRWVFVVMFISFTWTKTGLVGVFLATLNV